MMFVAGSPTKELSFVESNGAQKTVVFHNPVASRPTAPESEFRSIPELYWAFGLCQHGEAAYDAVNHIIEKHNN